MQSTSLNLSNFLINTLESGLEALDEFLDELPEGFRNGDTTKPFRWKHKKVNVINFGRSAFEHLTKSLPKIISLTWRKITSTFHKRL